MRRSFFRFVPLLGLLVAGVVVLSGGVSLPGLGNGEQVAATSYDTMSVTLKDGSTQIVRWNSCQQHLTYQVNLAGVSARGRAATLRTIKRSFTKAASINGLNYRYRGTTDFVPTKVNMKQAPAEIVVAAVDPAATDFSFEGDTLGVGGVLWNSWKDGTGESRVAAVRGYILLNARSLSALEPGFGTGNTTGNLVQHELGHVMGLEHVQTVKNLMDPELTRKSPNGYGPGDRRGLQFLGAGVECTPSPASALPDLS